MNFQIKCGAIFNLIASFLSFLYSELMESVNIKMGILQILIGWFRSLLPIYMKSRKTGCYIGVGRLMDIQISCINLITTEIRTFCRDFQHQNLESLNPCFENFKVITERALLEVNYLLVFIRTLTMEIHFPKRFQPISGPILMPTYQKLPIHSSQDVNQSPAGT